MGDPAMPYFAQPQEELDDVAGRAVRVHLQQLFLNSGRNLVAGGFLVIISTVGNPIANAAHAFIGFLLLIMGVFLLMLSQVGNHFPGAARFGAAMANAVMNYFFALGN